MIGPLAGRRGPPHVGRQYKARSTPRQFFPSPVLSRNSHFNPRSRRTRRLVPLHHCQDVKSFCALSAAIDTTCCAFSSRCLSLCFRLLCRAPFCSRYPLLRPSLPSAQSLRCQPRICFLLRKPRAVSSHVRVHSMPACLRRLPCACLALQKKRFQDRRSLFTCRGDLALRRVVLHTGYRLPYTCRALNTKFRSSLNEASMERMVPLFVFEDELGPRERPSC